MGNSVTFRMQTGEFDQTLKQYSALSKKTPAEICNKKAYFILRRAVWHTHKASIDDMRDSLGEYKRMEWKETKRGKLSFNKRNIKSHFAIGAGDQGASMLAMIIQARVIGGKQSKQPKILDQSPWKGVSRALGAQQMVEMMRRVFAARTRSIAFIKSGWIYARDVFKPYGRGGRNLPPMEGQGIGGPKVLGDPGVRGGASVASEVWSASAKFWNTAWTKHDSGASVFRYGEPALQQAFDEETADTMQEVERRLREHAAACGIRTQ